MRLACIQDHIAHWLRARKGKLLALLSLSAVALDWSQAALAAGRNAVEMSTPPESPTTTQLSLKHFNYLYEDLSIGGTPMGLVRIYARFPDYAFATEPNEGFACVDDAARAIVMLARQWRRDHNPEIRRKVGRLSEFVLHLQNRNGYFNNFLRSDLSINRDYRTSVAELNWWSWRALWGLEEALPVVGADAPLAARIRAATARMVRNVERDGLDPATGSDQTADAVIAMLAYHARTNDPEIRRLVESFADHIVSTQMGGPNAYPYGMFVSTDHQWHAWGNIQAYALLLAGERLARDDYVASALREVDNFYPYILRTGFAGSIRVRRDGDGFVEAGRDPYPQIAYGVRPMIFASMKAYALTKQERYRILAKKLAEWLFGANDADTPIYHPESGIAFDGILGRDSVNRNSGAESTIEALLALQALEGDYP